MVEDAAETLRLTAQDLGEIGGSALLAIDQLTEIVDQVRLTERAILDTIGEE